MTESSGAFYNTHLSEAPEGNARRLSGPVALVFGRPESPGDLRITQSGDSGHAPVSNAGYWIQLAVHVFHKITVGFQMKHNGVTRLESSSFEEWLRPSPRNSVRFAVIL